MRILVDPETGEMVEVAPAAAIEQQPYDYREGKAAVMAATRERREAERVYRLAIAEKGAAERAYRHILARKVMEAKTEHGATIAETVAKGTPEVGEAKERSIIAEGMVYAAVERLRLCSEDRASLHRLIDWSRELST